MPTVPVHEGRRITRQGIPDARRSAASSAVAEGAGLAQAQEETGREIARLGSTVARIGTGIYAELRAKERRRADEVALLEANNQLDAFELGLNDPNGGAFHTRGKAAFDMPEKVETDFNALADKISQGLGTPEQKLAFEKMRSNRGMGILLNLNRHVAGEIRSYEQGQLEGTLVNAVSLAGANAQDPARVAREIEKGEVAIRTVANGRGQSAEQTEQQLLNFRSGAHLSVINNLVSDNPQAASAYFEETKDQIAGDKWDEVKKQLKAGTQKKQAQTAADEIVAAGGTLTEQRAKAKAIEDSDVRDQTLAYIEHEAAVVEREQNDAHKEVLKTGVYDVLDKGRGIRGIDSRVWANLSGDERRSAQIYAEAKARGIPIQTDASTFYSLMRQAIENPDAFVNTNLMQSRHRLSDPDLQQLASLQLSISRSDKSAADQVLAGFSTKQEIVDNTLATYGIDPKAKADTAEGKAVAQLYRMLDRRVDAVQTETGKKLTNTEIQQTLDGLLSQGTTVEGSWWNIFPGGKPFFDTKKRLIDTTADDIPSATKKAIEDARRKRGLPVSDATTLDTYLEMQVK
jgi:hypothetical protein